MFDKIHDVELGIKFFNWVSKQETLHFPFNGLAYSSFLKLLARFKLFSEIDTALENMKMEETKPTFEAFLFVFMRIIALLIKLLNCSILCLRFMTVFLI